MIKAPSLTLTFPFLCTVIKAYSLFDLEVGYCQGISFVVGALLMNVSVTDLILIFLCRCPKKRPSAFLSSWCSNINLENFTRMICLGYSFDYINSIVRKNNFLIILCIFEGILKEQLPLIDRHLENEGINSNMYASQW